MANVVFDDRSFIVDGKRSWLVSGSIHYFRTPAPLWRDRLLKAKRAGLNCIDTYVAWNFHEMSEGKWDFSGDRDVTAFIRQAGELGMYVILRPGPFICAEWDFGGLPGWLAAKSGIAYRTNNAAYTHYYDKYFRQILPKLAELQVTHGGNIILIQNENEYMMTTMPERLAYLEFINQLFRRSGFDIPIINCNLMTDPSVPDNVECVNGWDDLTRQLTRQRARQPKAPLLVTEYWDGWFDYWGRQHQVRDARQCARRALEITGCGAQYNYYMWHGGTNFAFWGSRLVAGPAAYQTTSYDYDAPLAEGGGLTRKYYLTKLVNLFANHMGRFLSGCSAVPSTEGQSDVQRLSGPAGDWAIATNNGNDKIKTATIALPQGGEVTVSLELFGATAVPIDLKITASKTLEYANLMPAGLFFERVLLLHGPAGFAGKFRVDDKDYSVVVPAGDEPKIVDIGDLRVVVLSSELAMRTWLVDDTLVFGPAFVGATIDDLVHVRGAKEYFLLTAQTRLTHRKIAPLPARKINAPKLSTWKQAGVANEPIEPKLQWQKIDRPKDLDTLGIHYGYAWYRVDLHAERAGKKHLYLPECDDRATIFLNGKSIGVWGRGEGAVREPISAALVKGSNVLTMLVDNLGRNCNALRVGDVKGLWGHIFDAAPIKLPKLTMKKLEEFNERLVPRRFMHLIPELKSLPQWRVVIDLPMKHVSPVHLSYSGIDNHVAVICNGRASGFFGRSGQYGDLTLQSELKKGKNRLEILLWGDVNDQTLKPLRLWTLNENLTVEADWSYRPWAMPETPTSGKGSGRPAWFTATFARPSHDLPLFLHLAARGKGQIFLNGRNVGRYWTVGPQENYYLPSCWLQDKNQLLIFDETGGGPIQTRLQFCPEGPFAK